MSYELCICHQTWRLLKYFGLIFITYISPLIKHFALFQRYRAIIIRNVNRFYNFKNIQNKIESTHIHIKITFSSKDLVNHLKSVILNQDNDNCMGNQVKLIVCEV